MAAKTETTPTTEETTETQETETQETETQETETQETETQETETKEENPNDAKRTDGMKLTGKCKWFHATKGYGFIHECSDGGSEVFVHYTDVKAEPPALFTDQEVEFLFKTDDKGRGRAFEITGPEGKQLKSHASQRNPQFRKRLLEDDKIKLGTIKWFNTVKSFGFIIPFDGGNDIFMHKNVISFAGSEAIPQDTEVEYKLSVEEKDGKEVVKAIDVTAPGGGSIGTPLQPMNPMQMQMRMQMFRSPGLLKQRGSGILGKRRMMGNMMVNPYNMQQQRMGMFQQQQRFKQRRY